MENWLPAVFGLGGVLIGSLFSLWLTKLQLKNADKKFERELAKAREDAQRQRSWEVRSKPLLELRTELADMAVRQDKVVVAAHKYSSAEGTRKEQAKTELDECFRVWNGYLKEGTLKKVWFQQYDTELVTKVMEISENYQVFYNLVMNFKESKSAKPEFPEPIWPKVIEVQLLINKRLEEL